MTRQGKSRQLAVELRRGNRIAVRWFLKLTIYMLLIDVSYVFLYPVVYMISTSFKTFEEFLDPTVYWVPASLQFNNFRFAIVGLTYWDSLLRTSLISVGAAVGQTISCSLVGYGFARMRFKFRETLFAIAIFTFIVPPQTLIVPYFLTYVRLGWIDTYLPFWVPSFLANGLRGAIFIYIFRQFFRGLPWELEDAAWVDGAGPIRVYSSIMLPLAKPAILVSVLFSLVWHWNDFFEPSIYIMSEQNLTLALKLGRMWNVLAAEFGGETMAELMNQPLVMAGSLLIVLPMLVIYALAQRYFVEGIERTGLVG